MTSCFCCFQVPWIRHLFTFFSLDGLNWQHMFLKLAFTHHHHQDRDQYSEQAEGDGLCIGRDRSWCREEERRWVEAPFIFAHNISKQVQAKVFSKISSNVIVNSHLLTSDMITKQVEANHCKAQAQSIAGGGESHQVDYHGRYSKNARLESSIWSTFPHKWLLWSEVWARQGLSFLQVIQDKQLPCPDWRRAMMPLTHGDGLHKEHNLPFTRVLSSITRSNKLASLKVTQVRNYDPVTKSASHRGWSGGLLVTSVAKNGVCGCAPTCANMFFELLHKTI